jgi:hypothetical protein
LCYRILTDTSTDVESYQAVQQSNNNLRKRSLAMVAPNSPLNSHSVASSRLPTPTIPSASTIVSASTSADLVLASATSTTAAQAYTSSAVAPYPLSFATQDYASATSAFAAQTLAFASAPPVSASVPLVSQGLSFNAGASFTASFPSFDGFNSSNMYNPVDSDVDIPDADSFEEEVDI